MMLYQILEEQLKKEPNFVSDDGQLKKWVVLNKSQNNDPELIGLLLDNPELKKTFFTEIKGALVFNQPLFTQFLEQKNYLNDSYTEYKNKIGLSIGNKYIHQRNEVSLVWPFKDCVLEGGQSREEDKREEIFFNEVLAQDEITQLFEPKVLTNAKRYTKEGEKELDSLSRSEDGRIKDNLIIKGNNLLALHSLKKEFAGKVKMIYIDPPYNTGSDSFGYNDTFNRSTWLTFMKNRLQAASKLLDESGVILVQCSFHQFAHLKLLMSELFKKHLCDFNIQVRHPDRSLTGDKEFNDVIEYILIYSNDKEMKMPYKEEEKTVDDYNCKIEILPDAEPEKIQCGEKLVEVYTPAQYKQIAITPSEDGLKKISIRGSIREKNSSGRFFVKHLENFNHYPPETLFKVPDMGDDKESHRYFYLAPKGKKNGGYYQGMPTSSTVTRKQYSNFYNFEKDYNNVSREGGVLFRNGKKPEELLRFLIETFSSNGDIILDYHFGSGTTGAVSHKLGRQYIGVEQMQSQINLTIDRLRNVINKDEFGISKAVDWQGGGDFVYLELKKYNQEFIDRIESGKDTAELLHIWEDMKKRSFINYNVDIQKQDQYIEEFKALTLEDQKTHLVEILDKNQLYVNLSSLEDADFSCSDEEKRLSKCFYKNQ